MKYGTNHVVDYKGGQNLLIGTNEYAFPEPVTLYDHHAVGKVFVYWYRYYDMAGLMWKRVGESSVIKPIYVNERMFIYEAGGSTHVNCESPFTVDGYIIAISGNDIYP